MAVQINISRLQYYLATLNHFFNETLSIYFESLTTSPPVVVLRLGNNLDIDQALEINPDCQRILFWSLGNYGRLGELLNAHNEVGEISNLTDIDLSLFFVGTSPMDASINEILSLSLAEDFISFLYGNGGHFEFNTYSFESNLTFGFFNNLFSSGLEKSNKISRDFFVSYCTDLQTRINIKLL